MKFSVNSSDLKSVLLSVINVVPLKTTLPILGNVLFSVKDNTLVLSATDLEVTVETSIKVESEGEGGIALPARIVGDIIRQLPDIPLDILIDDNYRAVIKTAVGEYVIAGENESEFPAKPSVDVKEEIEIDSDILERMILKTIFAVSSGEVRSSLMGVYFQFLKDEFRAVSTDGHRLVKIVRKDITIKEDIGGFIIPPKALNQFLKNKKESEKVNISISDNYLVFSFDNYVVYSRLIEGIYPGYEKVIPTDNKNSLELERELMESSLRRVSIFANKVTQQVKLRLLKDSVEISAEDSDFGKEGKEAVPAKYADEEMTIGYNAGYVLDILGHIDTDKVVFMFDTPTSAGLIYPSEQQDNEDMLTLVMPIKLTD